MDPTSRPRFKVCCIASPAEAALALAYGASAVGLVSAMPSGPGVIDDERIAEIVATLPPAVGSFLLTSAQDVETIVAQQRRSRVNTVQLVDELPRGGHARLRLALPGIAIVQVIHVTGPASVAEALAVAPDVHALLLDSGNPTLAVKELGGTGRVHDWALSAEIRARAPVPVFLAGGLQPANVAAAVRQVRPYAVDVCSGLRSAGELDEARLAGFAAQLAAA
jgi:phosphoribosylanthranilate isomerase